MLTEIKLFLLTKHLMAIHHYNSEKVIQILDDLLRHEDMHPDYWNQWIKRYKDISESRTIQIVLLRTAGYSYRKIQSMINVSPTTIQKVVTDYDLNYGELEGTKLLKADLDKLDARLKKAGGPLW